ncbi:ABC-2 transporter permease [Clostridium tetani]|uniref:ABC-2 transporter permease n=1 Tax=Clostridium tetani TaxID=1513 RepID=A0ABY0EQV2_CLOTA|nr:ABC-2 transporter permease [Clostridium tetani]RXI68842.1 ABC-2 transporter permease [Clostridium tetani]
MDMKNIISRDLYLIKKQILFLIIIFIRLFHNNDLDVFYYYKIIVLSILILSICSIEKPDCILISLPITRKEIIISKYIVLNIISIFVIGFTWTICHFINYINANSTPIIFSIKDMFSLILLANIIFGTLIPLYYLEPIFFKFLITLLFFIMFSKLYSLSNLMRNLNSISPLGLCFFLLFIYYLINKSIKLFEDVDIY